MRVGVIEVPYNLGERDVGVGAGPQHLAQAGLREVLRQSTNDVHWDRIETAGEEEDTLQRVATINRAVGAAVTSMRGNHRLPLLAAGNCNTSLGAIAASDPENLGIIWFDAHGDFNTPETSASGFLDGMALAIATGRCYPEAWAGMGGKKRLPDAHIILAGVRDLDDAEKRQIEEAGVKLCPVSVFQSDSQPGFVTQLEELKKSVDTVFVHIDVDALDPSVAPGVEYKTEDGLSLQAMKSAIGHICQRFHLAGIAIADYSPMHDEDGRTAQACLELIGAALQHVANKERT